MKVKTILSRLWERLKSFTRKPEREEWPAWFTAGNSHIVQVRPEEQIGQAFLKRVVEEMKEGRTVYFLTNGKRTKVKLVNGEVQVEILDDGSREET